ncbi:hypothetical protein [Actinomadura viridis]|uniref:Transposase n=1 Tax=Actinomadura viridis TaxID=58110 RepID=A0A931GNE6_9ACTN|nr:hypothetical protein [Actinomadura viridis]MBG6093692.1 hypothetical protein [Actinomadura viridis]
MITMWWTCHSEGVAVRIAQRILAMTAAIWHNHHTAGRSPAH